MQSSANISGEPDARTLEQVPQSMLDGADLVLDGGTLLGKPSTVIDLREYSAERRWHVLREGALSRSIVRETLMALG
jgi:L-threonylcarbamoyladenylate synthase